MCPLLYAHVLTIDNICSQYGVEALSVVVALIHVAELDATLSTQSTSLDR